MCGGVLISKCGNVNIWHWAHESGGDCDTWSEPETDWHRKWKILFPEEYREAVIGPHRADVRTAAGWIFEFQNSPLSDTEISERENFYGRKFVWVLNAADFLGNFFIRSKGGNFTFRWFHPRKSWWVARRPIFLHLDGNWLFRVCKIHPDIPCRGWGRMINMGDFLAWAVEQEKVEGEDCRVCLCRGKTERCMICKGAGSLRRQASGIWL